MKGKGEVKTYWLIEATEKAIQKREVDIKQSSYKSSLCQEKDNFSHSLQNMKTFDKHCHLKKKLEE